MKDTNINLGINSANCIKDQGGLIGTTYFNICNDTHYFVPYGVADYALGFVLFLIFALLAGMLFKISRW